ncbi:contractile injection system protein, VgrG/Pvc8 family [Cupriavidus basilensis]
MRLDSLTQQSRSALRPFHGHVTRFEQVGANGGLVRYRLVIEPWLAFLRHRQDSFLFQDMSVIENRQPVWRLPGPRPPRARLALALRDSSVYTRRSVITQYDERRFRFRHAPAGRRRAVLLLRARSQGRRCAGRTSHGRCRFQRRVR